MKGYLRLTSSLFFIIGLLHLVRLIRGWEVQFAGWSVPVWCSAVGLVVAWLLAWWGMQLTKR